MRAVDKENLPPQVNSDRDEILGLLEVDSSDEPEEVEAVEPIVPHHQKGKIIHTEHGMYRMLDAPFGSPIGLRTSVAQVTVDADMDNHS